MSHTLGPSEADRAMSTSTTGSASCTSATAIRALSVVPPAYPATVPTTIPTMLFTTMMPVTIASVTRPPRASLLATSRPSESVPSQWAASRKGGSRMFSRSWP